ncbi:hypothetical protein GCM10027082_33280 [Comamonas humi]
MPNHMVYAIFKGDPHRVIGAAVIDDQPFHGVEARDLAWQILQGDGKSACLVKARNLDNELH